MKMAGETVMIDIYRSKTLDLNKEYIITNAAADE
jgi:hypothetical protein